AASSIFSTSGHTASNGSFLVRYLRAGLTPFGGAPSRYRRAVFSLIPLFSAARSSVSPSFNSFISLLTCWSLTNHALPSSGRTLADSASLVRLFGEDQPRSSSCRQPAGLIVAEQTGRRPSSSRTG